MPRSNEALVEPAILIWARSSAGVSVEEAAASLQTKPERVQAWENGEASPSMAQLRKMASTYKRMLSDFYLAAVPEEDALPHDFRRLPGEIASRYSRALRYQLRLARQRRDLALDLAAELEMELPSFTAHLQVNDDTEGTGAKLRQLLDLPLNTQRTWRDPRTSYNGWRQAVERLGILVFQAAGIPSKEMLGFSLSARPYPVIGVNRKLRPNGRTFTLLHECVHVFMEQSSLCDIDEATLRPAEAQRIEVFCNAVAAAALVPLDALSAEPIVRSQPNRPRDWNSEELGLLARVFGVSDEVILRRLLTAGRTSHSFYAARRAIWGSPIDDTSQADPDAEFKRNMPQEVVSDLGKPFTRLVVNSYLNSFTSLSDVSRYLGLRAGQVPKVQELLGRG
jgi:Zn-dependent peptidase ImmA (M78 family)/transcriptional regulator with XRE-family HTH domain